MTKTKAFLMVSGFAAINYFIVGGLLGSFGFNMGRVILAAWGGRYLVLEAKSNLRFAALVGIIILVMDHLILKGGSFLLAQLFWPETIQHQGILAFGGVLVSFVLLAPFVSLISFSGGYVGSKQSKQR